MRVIAIARESAGTCDLAHAHGAMLDDYPIMECRSLHARPGADTPLAAPKPGTGS